MKENTDFVQRNGRNVVNEPEMVVLEITGKPSTMNLRAQRLK